MKFVQSLRNDGKKPACPFCKQLCDVDGNQRKQDPKGSGGGNGINRDDPGDGGFRYASNVYSYGVIGEGMMM